MYYLEVKLGSNCRDRESEHLDLEYAKDRKNRLHYIQPEQCVKVMMVICGRSK